MSSPDQHTAYVRDEVGLETAIRFHLTSRVFPYWTNEQVNIALPALRLAIEEAGFGNWDGVIEWTYPGDGTIEQVTVGELFEGLNLWGLEDSDE